MSTTVRPARLRAEAESLAGTVDRVAAGRRPDGADTTAPLRLAAMLRGNLIPRLADPDRPLVVAIFGPTGSGKSTIVNTLAGRTISASGAVRPTTREAVVWVHRDTRDATGPPPSGPCR